MKRNTITKREVFSFKEKYCNENKIVVDLIRGELEPFFVEPILDIGAGIGDISYFALHNKSVKLLDVNSVFDQEFPCRPLHQRITADFFDYKHDSSLGTIFISHTLQFLDESIEKLNAKIVELNPKVIILVLNENDYFMGELVKWADEKFEDSNPEKSLEGFPNSYRFVKDVPFQAKLSCPNFEVLAQQIAYLMLIDLISNPTKHDELIHFLKKRLNSPEFTFNQSIKIYTR